MKINFRHYSRLLNPQHSIISMLILISVLYILLRIFSRTTEWDIRLLRIFLELGCYFSVLTVTYFLLSPLFGDKKKGSANPGQRLLYLLSLCACMIIFAAALWKPLCAGLVWPNPNGQNYIEITGSGHKQEVESRHNIEVARQGPDDTRNLIIAEYISKAKGNPFELKRLYLKANKEDRYFLDWHFSHHPPGIGIFYSFFYPNYELMRIMNFIVLMIGSLLISRTVNHYATNSTTGIAAGVLFLSVPNFWLHDGLMLSIDLLTAVPVFGALTLALNGIRNESKEYRFYMLSGLTLALSCFVKYSTAYWAGVLWVYLFFYHLPQAIRYLPIAVTCVALSISAGIAYSWIGSETTDFVLFDVIHSSQSETHALSETHVQSEGHVHNRLAKGTRLKIPKLRKLVYGVKYSIQFFGPPILLLVFISFLRSFKLNFDTLKRLSLLLLCALPPFLINPSFLRFSIPAAGILLMSLKVPEFLDSINVKQKQMLCAALFAFSLTKFVAKFYILGHG